MSYAISRRGVRTATAIGAVSLGLLALSACEKPTPMATATVNGESVSVEASCYEGGKTIPSGQVKECLGKKAEKSVKVGPGDKVRFGVDPDIAKDGWFLVSDNKTTPLPQPTKKTYHSFPGDAFFQQQSAMGQPGPPKKEAQVTIGTATGVWHVKLINDDA
ncbi:DUF2771 domain-containing protein [Streptomyces sp. ODS28]|uniref:DUF2771 domain-containing protein n=1 Tax=Streptomyces sp. ODS28 TaxID=3136688 RepID=UPI0031EA65F8